jgi:hypothetical protein
MSNNAANTTTLPSGPVSSVTEVRLQRVLAILKMMRTQSTPPGAAQPPSEYACPRVKRLREEFRRDILPQAEKLVRRYYPHAEGDTMTRLLRLAGLPVQRPSAR